MGHILFIISMWPSNCSRNPVVKDLFPHCCSPAFILNLVFIYEDIEYYKDIFLNIYICGMFIVHSPIL